MKAAFLDKYHETTPRLPRDRLLRHLERLTLFGARWPRLANLVIGNPASAVFARHAVGLRDLPRFPLDSFERKMKRAGIGVLGTDCALPSGVDPKNCVILVPDSYSGIFEPHIWTTTATLLRRIGFRVFASSILENGKALNIRGYGAAFRATAQAAGEKLSRLADTGVSLVGIEPAVVLLYRHEYQRLTPNPSFRVSSIDEFLNSHLDKLSSATRTADDRHYRLFLHCTEKTAEPRTAERWQAVFLATGRCMDIAHTGCCGMAGLFGHESEHVDMSRKLFDMSWAHEIAGDDATALITGYSCRSQARRFHGGEFQHPVEIL